MAASDLQQMHSLKQLLEDTFPEENRLQLLIKTVFIAFISCSMQSVIGPWSERLTTCDECSG